MRFTCAFNGLVLSVLSLSAASTSFAAEGGGSTGGGHAVTCFKTSAAANLVRHRIEEQLCKPVEQRTDVLVGVEQQITSVELLDLYEAGIDDSSTAPIDTDAKIHALVDHISLISPANHLSDHLLFNYQTTKMKQWYESAAGVEPVPDSGSRVILKENCVLLQAAVQEKIGNRIKISYDPRLQRRMKARSAFALQLHETLYSVARDLGFTDSRAVRMFIGDLFRGNQDELNTSGAWTKYVADLGLQTEGNQLQWFNYVNVGPYAVVSGDLPVAVRFDRPTVHGNLIHAEYENDSAKPFGSDGYYFTLLQLSFDTTNWTSLPSIGISISGANSILMRRSDNSVLSVMTADQVRAESSVHFGGADLSKGTVVKSEGGIVQGSLRFLGGDCANVSVAEAGDGFIPRVNSNFSLYHSYTDAYPSAAMLCTSARPLVIQSQLGFPQITFASGSRIYINMGGFNGLNQRTFFLPTSVVLPQDIRWGDLSCASGSRLQVGSSRVTSSSIPETEFSKIISAEGCSQAQDSKLRVKGSLSFGQEGTAGLLTLSQPQKVSIGGKVQSCSRYIDYGRDGRAISCR